MKRLVKGKDLAHINTTSKTRANEEFSIHTGQPKSNFRSPRWPEEHNVVLGELLLEQFVNGNICNGNLKKEQWSSLVVVLNRRLGTHYTESSVMIRFKNMKADFRMLYQLINRSGWGWDEELHIPIATDELWNEIGQANPKLLRYRRNPFHQYDIFEKSCADNIAIEDGARSTKLRSAPINLEFDDSPQYEDEFLTNNGVSFNFEATPTTDLPDVVNDIPPSAEPIVSPTVGLKRATDEPKKNSRRSRKKGEDNLNKLLLENNKNAVAFTEAVEKSNPYSMTDCIEKIGSIDNLTTEAIVALIDSIKNDIDNKTTLMTLKGEVLHKWIEFIVENNPKFSGSRIWM